MGSVSLFFVAYVRFVTFQSEKKKNKIEVLADEFSEANFSINADFGEVVNYSTFIIEVQRQEDQIKKVLTKPRQRRGAEKALSTCVVYRLLLFMVVCIITSAVVMGALHFGLTQADKLYKLED